MNILELAIARQMSGGGGGGGGVSSWDELTGKPFDANNIIKPEALPEGYPYKEQKLVTEFLPETKLTFYTPEGAPEGFVVADDIDVPDFGLKVSTAYVLRVMWDGVAYDREVTIAEPRVYAVGNAGITNAATGGNNPDTGEPFFITIVGMAGNTVNFGIMADSMGEHTVSIYELTETIHTMAEEFLPAPKTEEWTFVLEDDSTVTKKVVVAE